MSTLTRSSTDGKRSERFSGIGGILLLGGGGSRYDDTLSASECTLPLEEVGSAVVVEVWFTVVLSAMDVATAGESAVSGGRGSFTDNSASFVVAVSLRIISSWAARRRTTCRWSKWVPPVMVSTGK